MTVTTDWDTRLASRGQGRRKTRLAVTATVVLLLLLGGLAGWLLLGTGVLGVRDVQVTGTSLLDPAEVRSVAAIRLMSAICCALQVEESFRLRICSSVRFRRFCTAGSYSEVNPPY